MGEPAPLRPARILLVEDNETDVILTREGFLQARLPVDLHHVENGRRCLAFLRKEGEYAGAPTPDLILLDLNFPVMDGRQVLAALVVDEALKHLPVVVLTTSEDQRDVLAMYRMRCSAYVSKPVDFNRFRDIIRDLFSFWFTRVVLPSQD